VFFALVFTLQASAAGVAVVDFQRAVNETDEGKAAQAKLDGMFQQKRSEIDKLGKELQAAFADYEKRKLVLSQDARGALEEQLRAKQGNLQGTQMQYEQQMQKAYYELLQNLDVKMRALTGKIAKEHQYELVLDSAVVVFSGEPTIDMTDELIKRYNAGAK
jgi:outer membrane protein